VLVDELVNGGGEIVDPRGKVETEGLPVASHSSKRAVAA
jgi:hypothetical protein